MKDYFGSIDSNKFSILTQEEQYQYLLSKKLFYLSSSIPVDIINSKLIPKNKITSTKLKPNKDIIVKYYDFVLNQFEFEIRIPFLKFYNDFDNKKFGLEFREQRKIGLHDFNELYSLIGDIGIRFIKAEKSDSGIEHAKTMKRFEFLKYRQNAIVSNITTFENILEFLAGNKNFFNSHLLENNEYFKDVIEFEYILKILVSLNDLYNFEDDLFFSEKGILKDLFEKYTNIFSSFELFFFIHKKITGLKPAHIESLYEALLQRELIGGNKVNFIDYLNSEHGFDLSKIRTHSTYINRKHDFRVKNFKRELLKYSSLK